MAPPWPGLATARRPAARLGCVDVGGGCVGARALASLQPVSLGAVSTHPTHCRCPLAALGGAQGHSLPVPAAGATAFRRLPATLADGLLKRGVAPVKGNEKTANPVCWPGDRRVSSAIHGASCLPVESDDSRCGEGEDIHTQAELEVMGSCHAGNTLQLLMAKGCSAGWQAGRGGAVPPPLGQRHM